MRSRISFTSISLFALLLLALSHVSADALPTPTPAYPSERIRYPQHLPTSLPLTLMSGIRRSPEIFAITTHPNTTLTSQLTASLRFDDFSDPNSGWYRGNSDDGYIHWGYVDGEYQILIHQRSWWAASISPWGLIDHFAFEAQGHLGSDLVADWGLIFGIQPESSAGFYYFGIDNTGQYSLWVYPQSVGEPVKPLVYWMPSPEINRGTAINQLRVERDGAAIRLYANGTFLKSVVDTTYLGVSEIGLFGSTGPMTGTMDFRFDNARLSSLEYVYLPLIVRNKGN